MRLPSLSLSILTLLMIGGCTHLSPPDRVVARDFGLAAGAFTAWGLANGIGLNTHQNSKKKAGLVQKPMQAALIRRDIYICLIY